MDILEKLQDAYNFVCKQIDSKPTVGIILGTGLGGLIREIEIEKQIPYNFIPYFPISTVESHFGKLIFGKIGSQQVVAMQGRFHLYEGYTTQQVTFPIRLLKLLGVQTLFISNAAGGLNPNFKKGDLMVIEDHINLQNSNPLIGPNRPEFGPRFPDMSCPYDKELITKALAFAHTHNIRTHEGVYIAVSGPNLETRAEYRFLRMIGGDVVGMSTVPEVIVANHAGLRTFAVSVITDECDPENLAPVSVEEIIAVANHAEPKLTAMLKDLILNLQ